MEENEIRNTQAKVGMLRQEQAALGPVMRGSVVVIGTRNKQPYLSLNKDRCGGRLESVPKRSA